MADRIRYVNTSSSAGGDGTTNATTGDNRAYAGLAACLAAQRADLVTATDRLLIYCDAPAGTADTTKINEGDGAGWVTNATYGVVVRPNTGNEAGTAWSTSKYRLELTDLEHTIHPGSGLANITLENIQLRARRTEDAWMSAWPTSLGVSRLYGCFVRLSHEYDTAKAVGVTNPDTNLAGIWMANCIVVGDSVGSSFTRGFERVISGAVVLSYNNTIIVSGPAFAVDGGAGSGVTIKNTIVQSAAGFGNDTPAAGSDYNLSNTATATGGANDIVSETVTFVGSGDYALNGTDTSGAIGGGVSLAADGSWAFAEDIVGTARPQGTDWDIGAFEYVSGSSTPVPVFAHHYRQLMGVG